MKLFFKFTNPRKETTMLGVLSAEAEMYNTSTEIKKDINLVSVGIIFCQVDILW